MENVKDEMMEAIVLAGGMGTRLKAVIQDIPKPMAPIGNRPFLSFLLDDLQVQGVKRVILSTGYKHEVVEEHYKSSYKGMEVVYSVEDTPLGTGGAIKKALGQVKGSQVLILNGDTMFRVNLQEMRNFHLKHKADFTLALKKMEDSQRYGVVETKNQQVVRFREKTESKSGAINGGIYMLKKQVLLGLDLPEKFSFEKDFMETYYQDLKVMAFESEGYFIDIGIPEDYSKAQNELTVTQ
jgi:D-glycero-alpha-D-manno-heptose 1-phosphate guanylyltransferase